MAEVQILPRPFACQTLGPLCQCHQGWLCRADLTGTALATPAFPQHHSGPSGTTSSLPGRVEMLCHAGRIEMLLTETDRFRKWPAGRQLREIAGMSMIISLTSGRSAPLGIVALCFVLSPLAELSGCYSVPEEVPAPPPPVVAPVPQVSLPPPPPRPKQELASWYGPGFNGRLTTTGERYNQNAMTAASKTLPLGSHVVVTNPENGRSVEVRINDRGPHKRGRTLDLSKRAAQKLGITKKGVARVEVTPSNAKSAGVTPIAPSAVSATPVPQSHI